MLATMRQGRGDKGDGVRVVACKPGAFRDFVDLSFEVRADGALSSATVKLDRQWAVPKGAQPACW